MRKKTASREKVVPLLDQELVGAKGSSGYNIATGRTDPDPNEPPPPGGEE